MNRSRVVTAREGEEDAAKGALRPHSHRFLKRRLPIVAGCLVLADLPVAQLDGWPGESEAYRCGPLRVQVVCVDMNGVGRQLGHIVWIWEEGMRRVRGVVRGW